SGMFDPATCSMMQGMTSSLGNCTQDDIDEYTDCISTSCEPTLKACYGSDYRSGKFSGPCKDQLECATKTCKCSDTSCQQKCQASATCGQCFVDHPCGTDCKIPSCALGGALGDAGISHDKTCDVVLECCNALAGDMKKECTDAVAQIKMAGGANADIGCAA